MERIGQGTANVLLSAVVAISGTGCARCWSVACIEPYRQVVLTDVEGRWISEYIAEGPITTSCDGVVCFTALQRRIFTPYHLTFRYPCGRWVKVRGSHVLISPVCPPPWITGG